MGAFDPLNTMKKTRRERLKHTDRSLAAGSTNPRAINTNNIQLIIGFQSITISLNYGIKTILTFT